MTRMLGNYPVIQWVLERARQAQMLDCLVLATTKLSEDDCLKDAASELGVASFRGDADDVLKRFVDAALQQETTVIVRICADNPFVAPSEIDRIIRLYLEEAPDYAFNHVPRLGNNYPDGLGAEVLSLGLLERIDASASGNEREHVTLHIWNHPEKFVIRTVQCPAAFADPSVKLDVDTAEDLALLNRFAQSLSLTSPPAEILAKARQSLS